MLTDEQIEALVTELWPVTESPSEVTWERAANQLSGAAEALSHAGASFEQVESVYLLAWVARRRATEAEWERLGFTVKYGRVDIYGKMVEVH